MIRTHSGPSCIVYGLLLIEVLIKPIRFMRPNKQSDNINNSRINTITSQILGCDFRHVNKNVKFFFKKKSPLEKLNTGLYHVCSHDVVLSKLSSVQTAEVVSVLHADSWTKFHWEKRSNLRSFLNVLLKVMFSNSNGGPRKVQNSQD